MIVERAADARDKEERQAILEKEDSMHKSKLKLIQLCRELDTDKNGRLSEDEFLEGFENNPQFAEALLGMGVYPEDIGLLFDVLDTQGSGEVTYVGFVNTLARLRTQMSQVILFSITELRKTVSQIQSELGTGSAHQPQFGNPNMGVDGDNVKTFIASTEQGIDKILARQMEEMNKEMQLRFQQMHLEISSSFNDALRISIEAKNLEKSQLDAMCRDLNLMSKNAEEASDQLSVWSTRRETTDLARIFSDSSAANLPTVQTTPAPTRGVCCGIREEFAPKLSVEHG